MYLVLNAQLPPTNAEDISNIVFPENGEAQVTIPASAIIHQRNTEGTYLCHDIPKFLQSKTVANGSFQGFGEENFGKFAIRSLNA